MDFTLLKIAYRNLWQRKERTRMVIAMIAVCLAVIMFQNSLWDEMAEQMTENNLLADYGHVAVFQKDYWLNRRLGDRIHDKDIIERELFENKYVKDYSTRLKLLGAVASARYTQGITITGIDIAREKNVTILSRSLITGNYQLADNEILIGQNLAEDLKVRKGKKVVITGQDTKKEIVSAAFKVAGIVKANNGIIDKQSVFMTIESAQKLFKVEDGVSQFTIVLNDRTLANEFKADLEARIGTANYEVKTAGDIDPMTNSIDQMMTTMQTIIYTIIFAVIAIGLFSILLISVMERIKEFGIMLSVGTKFSQVATIIMLESLTMSIIGYAIGITLGSLILAIIIHLGGVDLSSFGAGFSDFGIGTSLMPSFKLAYFTTPLVATIISAILAAIWPIRKLKKLKPIEAVNFT